MKTGIKVESQEQKDNLKNTRKTLKVLQQAADDKENLVGRLIVDKSSKLDSTSSKHETKRKKFEDKSVQVGETAISVDDLTSDEPSEGYWKKLAQKREEMLDESFKEKERLQESFEALQEEHRICKEMLDEAKHLVEILQEMIEDGEQNSPEVAEEANENTK